ncbi:hypothetical protein UFOVP754_51 [uncultured Caudovirales phage]|uniref:Uncharacterized protein n=1 Tax=uncultured Caudovirales phage TaxID=2100421 RepID=A0A6J7X559_9CAUD|nr:hypothetical protein UFOVP754_51 [uncultured Caudovirales phage]
MYKLPEHPLYPFGAHCEPLTQEQIEDHEIISFLENSRPEIFEQLIAVEAEPKGKTGKNPK